MKHNRINSIHEVANLFDITVPTLHYWEKKDLFHINKNKENQYREFTFSDILNIWEIVFYRELNIPIRDIQTIINHDLKHLEDIFSQNEEKLKLEIQQLNNRLIRLQNQKFVIQLINQLQMQGLKQESPDFTLCQIDNFEYDSIKISLENPYRCCMHVSPDFESFQRGIQVESCSSQDILWQFPLQQQPLFYSFLLKINIANPLDNNLSMIYSQLKMQGLSSGEVIARYLLTATDESSATDVNQTPHSIQRYEYYKAWIQIL